MSDHIHQLEFRLTDTHVSGTRRSSSGEGGRAAAELEAATGKRVNIRDALARCVAETQAWWPEDFPEHPAQIRGTAHTPAVEVTGETTLAAARRVTAELGADDEALCLSFASARKPGGGFRSGALAQEETLARASGLYASLARQPAVYA